MSKYFWLYFFSIPLCIGLGWYMCWHTGPEGCFNAKRDLIRSTLENVNTTTSNIKEDEQDIAQGIKKLLKETPDTVQASMDTLFDDFLQKQEESVDKAIDKTTELVRPLIYVSKIAIVMVSGCLCLALVTYAKKTYQGV